MPYLLAEAVRYEKKYTCPYCSYKNTRMKLVSHIDNKHQDMIPKGYTATRVVFNMINKKDHGVCVICGKETEWDEEKARYNRFCGSKKCHDIYVKRAHDNTKIEEKLKDPYFQQKMLAGRSISGTYKFSDGGKVSYTGSYEKKLLEFLDKMLNIKSEDIQSPGPVIEYKYKGENHIWITDQYYVPYNLVFDVKDGGDNPNNREMTEYREKQIAKEEAIKKQGKYNYIRLTNNDFGQLIEVMLELKEMLGDETRQKTPIIKINENSNMTIGALPPANAENVYIIDYLKRNSFSGENEHHYALCKDYMQDAVTVNDDGYETIPFRDLMEMDLKLYKYTGHANFMDIIELSSCDADLYKSITGSELLDPDQLDFDNSFKEVFPFTKNLKIASEAIIMGMTSMKKQSTVLEGVQLPYFELEQYNKDDCSAKFYRDIDGVFLMNEFTGIRTKSYSDIEELKKYKYDIASVLR